MQFPNEETAFTFACRYVLSRYGVPEGARRIQEWWGSLSNVERAALAAKYDVFARPKQLPPARAWRTWGFLTGRGFGKTWAVSNFINAEVAKGAVKAICLMAQDEANAVELQVLGPTGLIATSTPWFKAIWEASRLQVVWPNGARAIIRTPEVPGKIRGFDYDLAWLSEIQSWPASTRDEAYSNVRIATRVGLARLVWDATPKRRHPILKELLVDAEREPHKHVVVRGTTHENADNLAPDYVSDLERKYGGTLRGLEELLGEMLAESETALVRQAWIDSARRARPAAFARKVLGVDPAVTSRAGSDRTGIIKAGLGGDGQAYILGDYSGKHAAPTWARLVLEQYFAEQCDCVVVETNKGGDLVTSNLRAQASERGCQVIVAAKDEKTRFIPGTVYVKEVYAKGPKEDRAQPLATAYERGRISHVNGADLTSLEDMLTSWEPTPGQRSPDALDAEVHAVTELLDLRSNEPDPHVGFQGIQALSREISAPTKPLNMAHLLAPIHRSRI